MNDVMFNIYEYLDPVYTGSSTMYSIDIDGLYEYRYQTEKSDLTDASEDISKNAANYANNRIRELRSIYETEGKKNTGSDSAFSATEEQMKAAIAAVTRVSSGYKKAVSAETLTLEAYQAKLAEDYQFTLDTFKKELQADFKAAKESFDVTTAPYNEWKDLLENDVFKFFLYEGRITPKYEKEEGSERPNRLKILDFYNKDLASKYTEETAIELIYRDTIKTEFDRVLTQWGTAGTLLTQYTADATSILLHKQVGSNGMAFPYIRGVKSLGQPYNNSGEAARTKVTVNGKEYKVATEYNADGTVKNDNEYAVLEITVNGTDPKAIYNFGFTVAPAHYYTADEANPYGRVVDIENCKFGVEWSNSTFQSKTIQSQKHVEVPVGAGPFMATDDENNSNPSGSEFWNSNIVYYKRNDHFMFPVKAAKLRLQVVSPTNALDKLEKGEVDYVTPQFTKENSKKLNAMAAKGFKQLDSWQLGYGYIGINAGKVENVWIRRAIMAAMQTDLACDYYEPNTCKQIDWPMSLVSWGYPTDQDGETPKGSPVAWTQWTGVEAAKTKINQYVANAAAELGGTPNLKYTFTIAGASITEHPTYAVFKQAAEILNACGWDVEVKADSQALTKLSTGALQVWAAAWGSTIDPDMYQVYHKDSKATSVYAWGYREIKADTTKYSYEYDLISKQLSPLIDDARSIMDQATRKPMYEEAMKLVLNLAIEMPVYQRKTLYAYNQNTLKGLNDDVNPYSSPLEKLWELELVA
jgi:peptide/nickel transport system substrate-binding protein